MSKHIKKEIFAIKDSILKYNIKIPVANKPKFERDLNMIFQDLDNTVDYDSLEQIKNLAKTRLITLKRIYGDIENQDQESNQKKVEDDLIRLSKLKINISEEKGDIKYNDSSVQNLEEYKEDKFFDDVKNIIKELENVQKETINRQVIDKNVAFDKKKVEEFRKINDELNMKLFNMYKEKQAQDKKTKGQSKISGDMMKDMLSEIIKNNNLDEKALDNFDFENFAEYANLGNLEKSTPANFIKNLSHNVKDEMNGLDNKNLPDGNIELNDEGEPSPEEKERIKQYLSNENDKKDEYFDIEGEKIFKNIRKEDTFDKILENKDIKLELTEQVLDKDIPDNVKTRIINYEKWRAENEIIRQQVDGEIKLDNYGSIEFKFYESEEEEDSAQSTGKETYVFRDGKMVKGKAKKRKTTTYSNWHSGNVDPDDLRKHRELLDRQHFGGPMWDGIKPRSVLDEVPIFPGINPENEVIKPEYDKEGEKKWGKKDFEEIVR